MDSDPEQAERVKLEVLFVNEGRLRSLISNLLKKQLYCDRHRNDHMIEVVFLFLFFKKKKKSKRF